MDVLERLRQAVEACLGKYGTIHGPGDIEFRLGELILDCLVAEVEFHVIQGRISGWMCRYQLKEGV
mgnify:CR=1 FL=1